MSARADRAAVDRLERELHGTAADAERELHGTAADAERELHGTAADAGRDAGRRPARRSPEALGGHDPNARKQATRKQRETGCTVYITGELLRKAGIEPGEPAPFYRAWAGPRGRVVVQLYRSR